MSSIVEGVIAFEEAAGGSSSEFITSVVGFPHGLITLI